MGLALMGCASLDRPDAAQRPRVEPLLRIQSAELDAAGAYALGKDALRQGRLEAALAWFDRAAALRGGWADPLNARAVALARLGRVDEAVQALQAAIAGHPGVAELHGNLGLLLVRLGLHEPALAQLDAALQLDAAQPAWSAARATLARSVSPAPDAPDMRPATASASAPPPAAGVEISNGAGLGGLARQTARHLATVGVQVDRLTNFSHFGVEQTQLHYRDATDRSRAVALAGALGLSVRLQQDARLAGGIRIRVVLGRDAAKRVASQTAWQDGPVRSAGLPA